MEYDVRCDECQGSGYDRKDCNYKCGQCRGTGFVEMELFSPAEMIASIEATKAALKLARDFRNLITELEEKLLDSQAQVDNLLATVEILQYALKSESARIDWINRQDLSDISMHVVIDAPHDGEYYVGGDRSEGYGKTLRDALDVCIQKEAAAKNVHSR